MIAPLALIGLLALPIIVAFYMLRLRRRDRPVGSTFLWAQLVRDVEANAPWQRLRFSWLLLLQLLIALLVVVAAARPFAEEEARVAANLVLVVDTSASMGAVEEGASRMALAREAAHRVLSELPEGGRVTVVAAADTADVVAAETDDLAAAGAAIEGIEATQLPGDLTDAFALASALAARHEDSEVVVVSDANSEAIPGVGVGAPVRVELVGETDANQAIAALSARPRSGGAELDVFVAVSNPSATDARRRLEVYADGSLVDARELDIAAGSRSDALISNVPPSSTLLEARLAGEDALAVDDRAFAVVGRDRTVRALLVSDGNAYLENALALLPRLELYAVGPEGYAQAMTEATAAGTPYGLLVYDRFVPPEQPDVPALYVAPTEDGPFGTVGPALNGPAIGRTDPDDPLLRFVNLSTVHVGRAREVSLADEIRTVVPTANGDPLVAAGTIGGRPLVLLTFALGDSDLPLQVAFPLLVSNLVDFLLPSGGGVLPASSALGEPIALEVDPSISSVTVVDGEIESELPLAAGRGVVPGAVRVGVRELRSQDGALLGQVASNLFDPHESAVEPGDPARFTELGRVGGDGRAPREPARNEWWLPLALAALALLTAEWLIFHRPTRRLAARWFRGTTGAIRAAGGPRRPRLPLTPGARR